MRWPFRRKSRPKPDFLCVVSVGYPDSTDTVSGDLLGQLVEATKQPALDALDSHFLTESWCSKITANASREGPVVYFSLEVTIQPGETSASMNDLVNDEFHRRWNVAAQRLLL